MSNSSILPIDRTISGATTLSQHRPGSDGNEGVLKAPALLKPQPLDCLVSYSEHSLEESYLFAEMQSVFSVASAN